MGAQSRAQHLAVAVSPLRNKNLNSALKAALETEHVQAAVPACTRAQQGSGALVQRITKLRWALASLHRRIGVQVCDATGTDDLCRRDVAENSHAPVAQYLVLRMPTLWALPHQPLRQFGEVFERKTPRRPQHVHVPRHARKRSRHARHHQKRHCFHRAQKNSCAQCKGRLYGTSQRPSAFVADFVVVNVKFSERRIGLFTIACTHHGAARIRHMSARRVGEMTSQARRVMLRLSVFRGAISKPHQHVVSAKS